MSEVPILEETDRTTGRDGTTTTVLLAAEWLQNAWHLVVQGVHPATIARGYRIAEQFCRDAMPELSVEASKEQILAATKTSLAGKLHSQMQSTIAECAVTAAETIAMRSNGKIVADPTRVKVITRSGPTIDESNLITGLALSKKRAHRDMPSTLGPGSSNKGRDSSLQTCCKERLRIIGKGMWSTACTDNSSSEKGRCWSLHQKLL